MTTAVVDTARSCLIIEGFNSGYEIHHTRTPFTTAAFLPSQTWHICSAAPRVIYYPSQIRVEQCLVTVNLIGKQAIGEDCCLTTDIYSGYSVTKYTHIPKNMQ